MPPDQMLTRRKCINYQLLNDSSYLSSSPPNKTEIEAFTNISDNKILPSESVSQNLVFQESSTVPSTSNISKDALYQNNSQPFQQHQQSQQYQQPAPVTKWLWIYFEIM
ncbi:hypothetical protein BDV12DRAFT_177365, partial [Aspergillus spectabilis]